MIRALAVLLALSVSLSAPAAAQDVPSVVKYGKWLVAAGAVGMNVLAARDHHRAEEVFDALEGRCSGDPRLCDLGDGGEYLDAGTEALYQQSVGYDRRARRWLIGGETALLGAAAMFVWELTRKTHRPDNIPFEPEVRSLRNATGVGLRFSF
ncbi:MAG: hypothetical protein ACR2HK_08530 [Gemmatimonadales bacterium]